MILSNVLHTSLNNFSSETNIKDVLKAISEMYCGRLVSHKQINFIKQKMHFLNIYVCKKMLMRMIVCLHCHEPVTTRLVLFMRLVE